MTNPSFTKVPRHIAVIMDGNGRWAEARGLPRLKGHEEGAQALLRTLRACKKFGVQHLTVYAFSTENWKRPEAEVSGLMNLLAAFCKRYEKDIHKEQVSIRAMGQIDRLPSSARKALTKLIEDTRDYERTLTLCLSYGSRTEITDAARKIAEEVRAGKLNPDEITEEIFADHLYLPEIPDPDLMIRTSGEFRLSNFLLWQLSYSEFYISQLNWPDFGEEELANALESFDQRDRRFGNHK
ncbi:isoprenyl transferase [Verrucomicrobiota bacterium]